MRNLRSPLLQLFMIFLCVSGSTLVFAQGRLSDKDVQSLMKNLKNDAKQFRSNFNSEVGKSTIRKTTQEKDAKALVKRFQQQTEGMLNTFKSKKKADQELPAVLSTSDQFEKFLAATPLDDRTTTSWAKVKTELTAVSKEFDIKSPTEAVK